MELAVVIPAYNEAECIAHVVRAWCDEFERLSIDYHLSVFNDGSTDETEGALSVFSDDPRVTVRSKPNSGHGPTILMGYRDAVERAEWVFQCDGDDEMPPSSFESLWRIRSDYDALFGKRVEREQSRGRHLISAVSRVTVRLAYGGGVEDVNTPYRLMRSSFLRPIVAAIPEDTFAPNLAIAGAMVASGARIANVPVPHHNRRTGSVSIVKWGLWKAAARSLMQTVRLAPRLRRIARQLRATGAPAGGRL